jgi:hypothetical protein
MVQKLVDILSVDLAVAVELGPVVHQVLKGRTAHLVQAESLVLLEPPVPPAPQEQVVPLENLVHQEPAEHLVAMEQWGCRAFRVHRVHLE